jgi:hypothetical protein
MPRASRVQAEKGSLTRTRMTFPSVWEMLHVRPLVQADEALDFSPSSDLRSPARKKAKPQHYRFPCQGTESIT